MEKSRESFAVGRRPYLALLALLVVGPVAGQLDGSFWWMNGNLLKQAEALRETKDVKAIVVTKDSELDAVRVGGNSLVDSNSPDCICVPLGRCAAGNSQPSRRDGLCGDENVCCRRNQIIAIEASATPPTTTTTTIRNTVASTKLKPVDSLIFDSDSISQVLPESLPYKPIPQNETEHDPALLLELSNLLLSHSIVDTFDTIDNNALQLEGVTTTETKEISSTSTVRTTTMKNTRMQCGVRRHTVTSRIFFQDDENDMPKQPMSGMTDFGEFPWTVAVYQLIRNGSFVFHCAGALLSNRVVVTAAHCVSNNRQHPNRFVVHAGDWDRRHTQERLPHQERTVSRIIVHPNYYSGALFNDVALLQFDKPFNDTVPNVGPVCLPSETSAVLINSSNCFVTGWGGSPKNNSTQSIQQYSKFSLLARQYCESRLQDQPSLGRKFKLHDSFVCAGSEGNEDSCQGSGGSPFVCERNGLYYLTGLVSWGIGCGDGIPVVLSNISFLSDWIESYNI